MPKMGLRPNFKDGAHAPENITCIDPKTSGTYSVMDVGSEKKLSGLLSVVTLFTMSGLNIIYNIIYNILYYF